MIKSVDQSIARAECLKELNSIADSLEALDDRGDFEEPELISIAKRMVGLIKHMIFVKANLKIN